MPAWDLSVISHYPSNKTPIFLAQITKPSKTRTLPISPASPLVPPAHPLSPSYRPPPPPRHHHVPPGLPTALLCLIHSAPPRPPPLSRLASSYSGFSLNLDTPSWGWPSPTPTDTPDQMLSNTLSSFHRSQHTLSMSSHFCPSHIISLKGPGSSLLSSFPVFLVPSMMYFTV